MTTVDLASVSVSAVLDGVNLTLPAGTITAVVGPVGAATTALASVLAGVVVPDTGTVAVSAGDRARPRRAGLVRGAEPDDLDRHRTVAGNIALPLEKAGYDRPSRARVVKVLLDLAGLTPHSCSPLDGLDPGERRRVLLARELARNTGLLIAEEPAHGLESSAGVLTLLDRARAELGTTVALLTADATAAAKVADQVALLRDGRIVACADVLGLAAQPDGPLAGALLPPLEPVAPEVPAPREHVLDAVLVGHATLRGFAEAMTLSGVDAAVVAGGRTWFGDTPIARYRVGVDGPAAHTLLSWLARHASHLRAVAPAGATTVAYAA